MDSTEHLGGHVGRIRPSRYVRPCPQSEQYLTERPYAVILDIPPVFTTFIILAGWVAKTAVSSMLSAWVGGTGDGEAWLAYSIP